MADSAVNKTQEIVQVYEGLAAEAAKAAQEVEMAKKKSMERLALKRIQEIEARGLADDSANEVLRSRPTGKKYRLNEDFNERSPEKESVQPLTRAPSDPFFQAWMPEVLKGQIWPDQEKVSGSSSRGGTSISGDRASDYTVSSAEEEEEEDHETTERKLLDNPYLSVSAKTDTIVKNSQMEGQDEAEWRKYKNEEFMRHLNANNFHDGEVEVEDDPVIADTFGNRTKGRTIASESFTPSSPLKLFGGKHDTYTKGKLKNILGYVNGGGGDSTKVGTGTEDSRLNNILKASDNVYNKVVASAKAAGQILDDSNASTSYSQDDTDTQSQSQDYTSDADEFRSAATFSAQNYFQNGDNILQKLKRKLSQPLPKPGSEVSDYTSDEDELKTTQISADTDSAEGDVTSSLEVLQKQLGISFANLEHSLQPVSMPKIKEEKGEDEEENSTVQKSLSVLSPHKYKGMNFISAEDYKDKVFDKQRNKYVSKDEYARLYGNKSQTRDEEDVFEGFTEQQSVAPSEQPSETAPHLSNLSFSQTNQALVSAITETYPEEDWDFVEQLVISGKHLDKLRGLTKFTPQVWFIDASDNRISHVQGVPQDVQILKFNHNSFDSLASFGEMPDLQVLELDDNSLENLSGLAGLTNITKLSLHANSLRNVEHLQHLKMLRYLNLGHNRLEGKLDFGDFQLWLLEDLILDDNKLTALQGLESLPNLVYLSANRNRLKTLSCQGVKHNALKRLCLNANKLRKLDLAAFPKLMRLELDRNELTSVSGLGKRLEKVSFRYQSGACMAAATSLVFSSFNNVNLRTAWFTGGSLSFDSLSAPDPTRFSAITRLDLSALGLEQLPAEFATVFPLVTDLNLNFNNLSSLAGLKGLRHVRHLKLLGNAVTSIDDVLSSLDSFRHSLRLLDLRVNPLTKGFYPYVFYDPEGAAPGAEDKTVGDETTMNGTSFYDEGNTLLNLHDYDDIEAFSVEYEKLYSKERLSRWAMKNTEFGRRQNRSLVDQKRKYHMGLILWFYNMRYLDGLKVDANMRAKQHERLDRYVR